MPRESNSTSDSPRHETHAVGTVGESGKIKRNSLLHKLTRQGPRQTPNSKATEPRKSQESIPPRISEENIKLLQKRAYVEQWKIGPDVEPRKNGDGFQSGKEEKRRKELQPRKTRKTRKGTLGADQRACQAISRLDVFCRAGDPPAFLGTQAGRFHDKEHPELENADAGETSSRADSRLNATCHVVNTNIVIYRQHSPLSLLLVVISVLLLHR